MILHPPLLLLLFATLDIGASGFNNFCYIKLDLGSCWTYGAKEVKIQIRDYGTIRKYPMSDYPTGVVCHPMKCINGLSNSKATIVATAITDKLKKIVPTDPTDFPRSQPFHTTQEQCFHAHTDVTVQCPSVFAGLYNFGGNDDSVLLECGSNEALVPVSKQFDYEMGAQKWEFQCKTSMKLSHSSCKWSEKVNTWDNSAFYQCPLDSVITGVKTYYDGQDEQPHFQFKCCTTPNYVTTGCKLTEPNEYPTEEEVLVGAFVPSKDSRNEEDWQFLTCNYDSMQLWNELYQD